MTGKCTYREAIEQFDIDIKKAPPMDRLLLIFQSGKDKVIPNGRAHADYFMEWAVGEKDRKKRVDQYSVTIVIMRIKNASGGILLILKKIVVQET